ncbi:hypothetical protein R69888_05060 [Paraburkholderia haematera]|uniref:Tyrosinase copper-binding domain-containing protein n=2 Tax=Paraburkholderia haematera TaxID=2793077 RepID=A0ABN7MCB1_9BURK|nr:hypothetical protein R69888_05060 [Paraburkholderia haematera]
MLRSYAKGIAAMLRLPAEHPQNWFRNAFTHLMDCPHGNWWFFVWHRGYVGYFEQTIRALSNDPDFAMPYWDWTQQPGIPEDMFNGVLTPTDRAYEPYTGNVARFTSFIKPALQAYWNGLNSAQRAQLNARGYATFDLLWDDVTGFSESAHAVVPGNAAYAVTSGARYLSRFNRGLDKKTAYGVSPFIVNAGLRPASFNSPNITLSFTSSKTASHVMAPTAATQFSILEAMPHNKVHNCIGGVGAIDPGPYGNMTNFLSPLDPIFYLHHANMDRLWDVWTRKQIALGQPYLPTGPDLQTLANEPFLFYVNSSGQYISGNAGDYFDATAFSYDYQPGFGEKCVEERHVSNVGKISPLQATINASGASVVVPAPLIQGLGGEAGQTSLVASITLPRPDGASAPREFDVLINAPEGVTQVDADSPYYAGTIAFFGPMMHGMKMSNDATFSVPLRKELGVFSNAAGASATLNIKVVPSGGQRAPALPLRDVSINAL